MCLRRFNTLLIKYINMVYIHLYHSHKLLKLYFCTYANFVYLHHSVKRHQPPNLCTMTQKHYISLGGQPRIIWARKKHFCWDKILGTVVSYIGMHSNGIFNTSAHTCAGQDTSAHISSLYACWCVLSGTYVC